MSIYDAQCCPKYSGLDNNVTVKFNFIAFIMLEYLEALIINLVAAINQ